MALFHAIEAWYVANFCYTLTVPEYKAYHVAKTLAEYRAWRSCYPIDANIFATSPKFKL